MQISPTVYLLLFFVIFNDIFSAYFYTRLVSVKPILFGCDLSKRSELSGLVSKEIRSGWAGSTLEIKMADLRMARDGWAAVDIHHA